MISRNTICCSLSLLLGSLSGNAHAAILITAPTNVTLGSLQITDDINFVATGSGEANLMVLDNWVTWSGAYANAEITPLLTILRNGLSVAVDYSRIVDNAGVGGSLDAGDGYLAFSPNSGTLAGYLVSPGDTITIKAGTYTLTTGMLSFNAPAGGVYEGNVFLADWSGNPLSQTISLAVPEPGAASLLTLGALAAGCFRRRPARR